MHPREVLGRIPLRLKVTAAFVGAMAVVMAVIGVLVYFQFERELDAGINASLRARGGDLAALTRDSETSDQGAGRVPVSPAGTFGQVLDARGRVLDGSGRPLDPRQRAAGRALLFPHELARAKRGPTFFGRREEARLFAQPVADGPGRVVVVGLQLEQRERALETLGGALGIGGPLGLLLAGLAGYAIASGALSPVESMRRRAATISGEEPGERLPLPPARDELQRLGSTLNDMLARLEQALDRERAFVADASHELRTPLAILKAELELAAREDSTRADLESAVHSATEETERLIALSEALLVTARAEGGRLPVQRRFQPIRPVLERVAARFARREPDGGPQISVEAAEDLRAEVDAARLEQALGKLVDNAVRHGGGQVNVTAVPGEGDALELHVTDHGDGFPPGFLEHAFERFTRADRGRTGRGAGLGLAIVAVVAQAHGGDAHAANRPSGGADVWLSLPWGAGSTEEAPAAPGTGAPTSESPLARRGRLGP